jgi:anti-sigma regulatory factor (Ser/Thr protein kinase)
MTSDLALSITEISGVAEARRVAAELATKLGFRGTEAGKVALVVTELGTNLFKHAKGGRIILRPFCGSSGNGLDILALDKGPGIGNVAECLRDGYSTSGSPGSGLGAVRRQAVVFDLHSVPDMGTAILARLEVMPAVRPDESGFQIGTICVPKSGEEVCGDGWTSLEQRTRLLLLIVDGLGHGPGAAEAARTAAVVVREHPTLPLMELIAALHPALRATRGAAMALAEIDHDKQILRVLGVGNVAGRVVAPKGDRSLVSLPGTVGVEMRKANPFEYPWSDDALLILHSDGLATHWNLARYPGLALRDPTLIAGVLFRDHCRGYDDTTVVVVKQRA